MLTSPLSESSHPGTATLNRLIVICELRALKDRVSNRLGRGVNVENLLTHLLLHGSE